jgi:hypothetical protein
MEILEKIDDDNVVLHLMTSNPNSNPDWKSLNEKCQLDYGRDMTFDGSSVTSLSDLTADELAFQECIEIINANVEEVITNKADAREKKWWSDGNYKIIDENR